MKTISDTKETKSVAFAGFQGIDTRCDHKNAEVSGDLVNLRIRHDGSLEKREGYRHLTDLDGDVRALWSGKIGGEDRCYALVGSSLLRLESDGSASQVATAPTSEGEADLFFYRDRLYLADGTKILGLANEGLTAPVGYVPLVANNWKDGEPGEIYQPRNLLCNRARFGYLLGESFSPIFYTDATLASVDAVLVNGNPISSDRYDMLSSGNAITVSELSAYDKVLIYATYAESDGRISELLANTRATVFGGANNSRPFLWGNSDTPAVMYASGCVSESELFEAQKVYPNSDALYFPVGNKFSVGDGQYTIRAVSRHYDRMLIFTEGGAWMASEPDGGTANLPVMNINSKVGALSYGAAAELENQPCTVSAEGIFRWNSDTDELNDCNAYSISGPIDERLSSDFFENAVVYANVPRRELWFTYPNGTGRVWVYSVAKNAWSRFEGVYADRFFDFYGQIAFMRDRGIYVFDTALYTDCGADINAYFESGLLDFGTDRKKQLKGVGLCFEGGDISADVYLDGGDTSDAHAVFGGERHGRVFRRLNTRRFGDLRVRLNAEGKNRQVIHSMEIKLR